MTITRHCHRSSIVASAASSDCEFPAISLCFPPQLHLPAILYGLSFTHIAKQPQTTPYPLFLAALGKYYLVNYSRVMQNGKRLCWKHARVSGWLSLVFVRRVGGCGAAGDGGDDGFFHFHFHGGGGDDDYVGVVGSNASE